MDANDLKALLEITRIAVERLQTTVRMKKPDINDWTKWASKAPSIEPDIDSFVAPPRFFHEFLHEFNRAASASIIPEECDVVSLMQNDGE